MSWQVQIAEIPSEYGEAVCSNIETLLRDTRYRGKKVEPLLGWNTDTIFLIRHWQSSEEAKAFQSVLQTTLEEHFAFKPFVDCEEDWEERSERLTQSMLLAPACASSVHTLPLPSESR